MRRHPAIPRLLIGPAALALGLAGCHPQLYDAQHAAAVSRPAPDLLAGLPEPDCKPPAAAPVTKAKAETVEKPKAEDAAKAAKTKADEKTETAKADETPKADADKPEAKTAEKTDKPDKPKTEAAKPAGTSIIAAAAAFGFVDDRIGPKRTILIAVGALTVIGAALLVVESKVWFWALALPLGLFFGPAQAASRSMMAHMAPAEVRTEMFGLYAFSGKATAFVGPFVFGLVTDAFDSQRAGMATILVFFVVGMALLAPLRDPTR